MPFLLQIRSPKHSIERDYLLTTDTVLVGRSEECDLRLRASTISRHHARLTRVPEEDSYAVENLSRHSFVLVNMQTVEGRKVLTPNDTILVGDVPMRFIVQETAAMVRPAQAQTVAITIPSEERQALAEESASRGAKTMPIDEAALSQQAPAGNGTRKPVGGETEPFVGSEKSAEGGGPPVAVDVPSGPLLLEDEDPESINIDHFEDPYARSERDAHARSRDPYTELRYLIHAKLVMRPEIRRDISQENEGGQEKNTQEKWVRAKNAANQIIFEVMRKRGIEREDGKWYPISVENGKLFGRVDPRKLLKDVLDEALGLGPIQRYFHDPDVEEIMVNGPSNIFIARHGKTERVKAAFISEDRLRTVIARIAAPLGRPINRARPLIDGRLGDGSRINAVIEPVSLVGPVLTIRKFPAKPLKAQDLVKRGALSEGMCKFLELAVRAHRNILVAGGTAAGKTTLLNVISSFIPNNERIVTIEDSAELRLQQEHIISLETKPAIGEGSKGVTIRDLVRNALRMRPDRIIVGECRGGEALDMLQAMNTGHDGSMTTGHANSARDMLLRLETMVLLPETGGESKPVPIPHGAIRDQISRAIHLIVFLERFTDGKRRISEIVEVTGLDKDGNYDVRDIFRYNYRVENDGSVTGTFDPRGYIPEFIQVLQRRGEQVDLKTIFQRTGGPAAK